MKKRVLSLILVLALCVGMVPGPVWAEEDPAHTGQEEYQEPPAPEGGTQEEPPVPEGENQEEPQEPEGGTQEEPPAPEGGTQEEPPVPEEGTQEMPQAPEAENQAPEEGQEDEEVKLVQALLDALPSPEEMSEEQIDALEIAFDAYMSLTEAQRQKITGADRFEALFAWVNGQVAMLSDNEQGWTENGNTVILTDYSGSKQLSLTQDTVLELNGTSKMEREYPILLNGHTLTVRGSGSLEVVMQSEEIYQYYYGAISNGTGLDDRQSGTLVLESGTLIAHGTCSGIAVGTVTVKGGSLYAYSTYFHGIRTENLNVSGENTYVYAWGKGKAGYGGISADKNRIDQELSIFYSDQQRAQEETMELGTAANFENTTVLICKSDKPMVSVGAQTGALYEDAGGTAKFTISGRNYTSVEANWAEPAPAGLTATVSGNTLTVTGDKTVRAGTYRLTLTATGANGTAVKTVSVTVSGIPLTIEKQPEDNVTGQVEQTDFRSAFVEVTPSRTDKVTYQWKVKGENEQGSDLTKGTAAKLYLADIPESMWQDTAEGWKKTARVYCTVTYDNIYSVDSEIVTVIFSTCDHEGQYSPKGECQRCGYQLDVNAYDWIYKGNKYTGSVTPIVGGGETVYLLRDLDTVEGGTIPENVTVDLQGHTVGSFSVQQFQNTTIQNGTITNLNFQDSDKNVGSVTLVGITVTDTASIGQGTTVTVGADCVFKRKANIQGETKLTGGTFEKGIAYSDGNAQHLLDILADGYAYFKKDDQGNDQICEYFRADSENVSVKSHMCTFSFAECVCGRVCKHKVTDENGFCNACGLMARPFAIGETRYATLKEAVEAAANGGTITMGSNARLERESLTDNQLTVSKNIILDLGGHTLAEECKETGQAPISIAGTVTIRNGTIENRYTGKPTNAVEVVQGGNLTVENAKLMGSMYIDSDQKAITGAVSVYGGRMTLVSGTVRGIFVDGDGESEEDSTFVRGSLTVTGGTVTRLSVNYGTVQLYGGTISEVENAAEALLKELLAPYHTYADSDNNPLAPDQVPGWLNNQPVKIIQCTHPAGISDTTACWFCGATCAHPKYENGVCTDCGFVCNHPAEKVDADGKCVCGLQMAVKVEIGDRVEYRTQEFQNGIDKTLYNVLWSVNTNATVTLLQDGLRLDGKIEDGETITLNVNGKTLVQGDNLYVWNGSTLKLVGSGSIALTQESFEHSSVFRVGSNGTLDYSGWQGSNLGSVYAGAQANLVFPTQGTAQMEALTLDSRSSLRLSGGRFGTVLMSAGQPSGEYEKAVGSFLASGYAFQKADGSYVDYAQEIANYKSIDNVTVVHCPHEKLPDDFDGTSCPYCNAALAALGTTAAGTKGYDDPQAAVDKTPGGTVVLLKDVAGTLTVSDACTLDFCGYTVGTLTVTEDVTLESLLPAGYAYKANGTWILSPSGQELKNVTAAQTPSIDLTAENTDVTVSYGQTATLKVQATTTGGTPTGQWKQKFGEVYTALPGETGDALTLSGLAVGNYAYRFTCTVDGYSKHLDFAVTVQKAPAQVKTAPTARLNLVYTGLDQELILPGAAESGTMQYAVGLTGSYSTDVPTAQDAGTYQVYYYAEPTDQTNYTDSEAQYIEVTIASRPMEDVTVTPTGGPLTYDGTGKTQNVNVTLGSVDVTKQMIVRDNTAIGAGTHTMTLWACNSNFSGEKEAQWSIAPMDITNAKNFELDLDQSLTYNGQEQTQTVRSLKINGLNVTFTAAGNTGKDAGKYWMTLTGTGNFTGSMRFPWTIFKAPLKIAAEQKNVAYGDPIPTYTATYQGFQNGETPDVLKGTLAFACAYTSTSQAKASYTVTPSGLTAQNYEITFEGNIVSVSPRTVTLTWTGTDLTYNGTAQAPTATAGNTINGDKLTLSVQGAGTDAGSYVAEVTGITGPNAENYWLPEKTTVDFAIVPVPLTVTANPCTIPYGVEPDNDGVSFSGFVNGEDEKVLSGTLSYTYSYRKYDDVGAYTVTPKGLTAKNYDIRFRPGTLTVEQRVIGIDWGNTGFVYTGSAQAPAATAGNTVNGDKLTLTVTGAQKNVGTYTASVTGIIGDKAGNYRLPVTVSTDFQIAPAPLTVTAKEKTVVYGDAPQNDGVSYSGFVGGEDETALSGTLDYAYSYTQLDDVGSYTTTPKGLTSENYDITFLPGTLTVSQRPVTLIWGNTAFTYTGTDQAPTATAGNTVRGDKLTLTVTGTGKNAGSYTAEVTGITGDNAENYCLPRETAVGFTIGQKPVSVQVTVGDKDFDGTTEAFIESAALTGILSGDRVEVRTGKAHFAHPAPGTWEVTLEELTLTGADAGNYSLANPQPTGLTATIRPSDRYLDLSQTFPEGTEITIDGKKQTVSTDGGSFVDLPQETQILTTYETNGSYPTGMRVYRILREKDGARLEEIPEFQDLVQYAGCSIRLTGTKGIRMITALDGATKAALTGAGLAGFTLEEYGTVVAKKSILGGNDLTLETGKHNYAYKKGVSDPVFATVGSATQYTNVLVGFSLEDCKEELVMRPYLLLRDEQGKQVTVYGGIVTRSIGYIAKQNENTYRPGTDGYNYIHEIIAAVYGRG